MIIFIDQLSTPQLCILKNINFNFVGKTRFNYKNLIQKIWVRIAGWVEYIWTLKKIKSKHPILIFKTVCQDTKFWKVYIKYQKYSVKRTYHNLGHISVFHIFLPIFKYFGNFEFWHSSIYLKINYYLFKFKIFNNIIYSWIFMDYHINYLYKCF